jgi:glycosyltransferase involved in cell wall biosynthesis
MSDVDGTGAGGARGGGARICVIRQHYVPQDTRVLREVTALAGDGHEVDVICVRKPGEPAREHRGRVTIRRLAVPRGAGGGPGRYLVSYTSFFLRAAGLATALHARRRYQLVQVNTLPDVLVFAALLPRLSGARLLLDLQECMPEFFATKFRTGPRHPAVRLIASLEQASIRFADLAITPTVQLRAAFVDRGADPGKISVIMDGADEEVFHPLPSARPQPGRFTLISHGTIEERYGLHTAIGAVALLRTEIPELELKIYGEGSDRDRLRQLATGLGVADRVHFSAGFVPFDELVRAIATADVGLVAMKRDAFRDLTLASKVFDFIAMGVPAAVSRTRSIRETFGEDCFEFFESGEAADLAGAIRRLYQDPGRRARLAARASRIAEPYRWPHQRARYLAVVNRLLAMGERPRRTRTWRSTEPTPDRDAAR